MSICKLLRRRGGFGLRITYFDEINVELTWNNNILPQGDEYNFTVQRRDLGSGEQGWSSPFSNIGLSKFIDFDVASDYSYEYRVSIIKSLQVPPYLEFISSSQILSVTTLPIRQLNIAAIDISDITVSSISFEKILMTNAVDFEVGLVRMDNVDYSRLEADINGRSYITGIPEVKKNFSSTSSALGNFSFNKSELKGDKYKLVFIEPISNSVSDRLLFFNEFTVGVNYMLQNIEFQNINPSVKINVNNQFYKSIDYNGLNLQVGENIDAKNVYIKNTDSDAFTIDIVIKSLDTNGKTNGILDYSSNPENPTNASRAAYDSLISKGWTITGTSPPTS